MNAVKTAAIVAAALMLSGCMANMTPEQRARTEARMAEPPPQTVSTFWSVPDDCDEKLRRGEVSSC